jgi:glutamyl-tRNA synthetase
VGNARTALFNWLLARGSGGTFILRIEDTDVERSTRESERGILEDLRWLGLEWDEGPDIGGPRGPYRQSERLHLFQSYANELLETGHAYHCFCTPEQLEADRQAALAEGRIPKYAGTCRDITREVAQTRIEQGEMATVRFRVPDTGQVGFEDLVRGEVTFEMEVIGDPVLLRSDGRPAYNFAVVIDDALMEITHVIRGEDHISNTPRQILLYRALGFAVPKFAHLSLVMGPDHTPLSKRHGATSVSEFRAKGFLPEALVNYLALIGWSPGGDQEVLPIDELARRFSIEDVGKSAGVFDPQKLAWMNRYYLREADPQRLALLALPYLQRAGYCGIPSERGLRFLKSIVTIATASVERLDEVPARIGFVFNFDAARAMTRSEVAEVVEEPGAREVIVALSRELAGRSRLDRAAFREVAGRIREITGQKGRALFHPIRVALTGEAAGPELDLAVPAIEQGAEVPPDSGVASIVGCRERASAFARIIAGVTHTDGPA